MKKMMIAILLISSPISSYAGDVENIQACVDKAHDFGEVNLTESEASYKGNIFTMSIVSWPNATCEVKFGDVNNLTVNGAQVIFNEFSGKASFELKKELEIKTAGAIEQLNSRIDLLEQRMRQVSKDLKEPEPDYALLTESVDKDIKKYLGDGYKPTELESIKIQTPPVNDIESLKQPAQESFDAPIIGNNVVTSRTLDVRLAPNKNGVVTNTLYKGQKVEVFEVKDGWARISQFYNGEAEGLTDTVARWVFEDSISTSVYSEKKQGDLAIKKDKVDPAIQKTIKSSEDFSRYQSVFISASEKLIKSGKCNLGDFKEMGGWWRSSTHQPKAIYFTYCGGMHVRNRIYLNAVSGTIF